MLSFVEHDFEVGFHAYLLAYLKNFLRNPRPLRLLHLRQGLPPLDHYHRHRQKEVG